MYLCIDYYAEMIEGAYCLVWYGFVWYKHKGKESTQMFKAKDICNAQACMHIDFWCKTV